MVKRIFEVQTYMLYGWENVWSVTEEDGVETADTYDSRDEAEDAINEFFADLGRAGMAQLYDREDYRVWQLQ